MTHRRTSARRALAAVAVLPLVLTAAACGSSSNNDSGSSSHADKDSAISAAPAGTFPGKKATGSAVTIGLISDEGGTNIDAPEGRVAAEAAVKYANADLGGLGGHVIKLDICKQAEDAPSATACANQMVQDGVAAVVITNTGQGPVMASILGKAGIAYTSYSGATPQELTNPTSFFWTGGVPATIAGFARKAAEQGAKNFTLFITDTGSVVAGVSAIAKPTFAAAKIDLTITPIPAGTPDATPQVTAGVKDKPTAVGLVGDTTMCTAAMKALSTLGTDTTPYLIQPCFSDAFNKSAGSALAKSVLFTSSDQTTQSDSAKTYRAVMAKYAPAGAQLSLQAPSGYQSMLTFINAAGSTIGSTDPTPANIIAALHKVKGVPLALGGGLTVTCDGKQFPGVTSLCGAGTLVGNVMADGSTPTLAPLS
ncbi:ABC transporter substrate-binding protein [Nocardioides sp. Iso805N]|uniref:ABC transporter substrate-binding protein n=1 Tax=Nocardioides sp. Iso805N TaxID=1283287 RepID=UPI0003667A8E|nr:ABC transporter substrate-binding protein [Nocardioides sp. Iso805N]